MSPKKAMSLKRKADDNVDELFCNESIPSSPKIIKVTPCHDLGSGHAQHTYYQGHGAGAGARSQGAKEPRNFRGAGAKQIIFSGAGAGATTKIYSGSGARAQPISSQPHSPANIATDSGGSHSDDDREVSNVEKSTNTEEKYVTDIEHLIKNYSENYKDLEIEQYKKMLQKFYTQNLRLATRCQKLKSIVEKNQTPTSKIMREVSKLVNPHQLSFITSQIINKGKPAKKRIWSPQMKNLMVGFYRASPAGFRFLSNVLILPEEQEVAKWISNESGNNEEINSEEKNSFMSAEAQAVLDEIAFENLMATLL